MQVFNALINLPQKYVIINIIVNNVYMLTVRLNKFSIFFLFVSIEIDSRL